MKMFSAVVAHLHYLVWHKLYVLRAGVRYGVPLGQLVAHDLSKFHPSEFMPYTRHFFLGTGKKDAATYPAFVSAFRLHCARNPHHWEHWVMTNGVPVEMPRRYALEMLADWDGTGVSKTGKNNTAAWYMANKNTIVLHPRTRAFVEKKLGTMCERCRCIFFENVALIADGDGGLADRQVPEVLAYLRQRHEEHA